MRAFGAGVANVARGGMQAAGQRVASGARAVRDRVMAAADIGASAAAGEDTADAAISSGASADASARAPDWARRLHRKHRMSQGASTAAHTVRSGDHGGSGASPNLHDSSNE